MFNLPVFAAKRIFKTYRHFCFLCFHSRGRFFWFHKDREITKSLFTLAESNFSERKLSCTRLNFYCGNETGSPGRAVSLHLARSVSQSEHRIRRILPARGGCHIINICYSPAGRAVLGKTVPEVSSTARGRRPRAALETEGTVFPNTARPRSVNNIFIYF